MSITSILRNFNGEPNLVTIVSDDTLSAITTAGYLTGAVISAQIQALQNGVFRWRTTDLVLIYYSGGIGFFTMNAATSAFVSLAANGGLSSTLSSGNLFVGNGANTATGVPLSGDATVVASGALTIANNAITTAKILNANVTLAKLAAGITPSHVIKFAGTQANGGGSATIAITVTGLLSTDLPFVQIAASTNAVTVQKATATANTLTVLLSGDPGAATSINYQAIRVAS